MKRMCFLAAILMCFSVDGRIQVRQVGSSTVYPFATRVAHEFSKKPNSICPLVESTGTTQGFIDLTQTQYGPWCDIVSASRQIKPEEFEKCKKAGISTILEVCIGIDGIALATKKDVNGFNALSLKDIFTAIVKKIKNNKGEVIDNPYQTWNEINPKLPKHPIRILIPSKTHGTRDAFETMIMHENAVREGPEVREISDYEAADCHYLLFDFLEQNKDTMAFVGTNLLESREQIKALQIDGIDLTYLNIQKGIYPLVRKLFIYVRNKSDTSTEGLLDYVKEWLSPQAIGKDGYLTKMGLVPLPEGAEKYKLLA